MSSDWPRRKGRGDIGGGIRLRFEVSALPGFRGVFPGFLVPEPSRWKILTLLDNKSSGR